MTTVILDVLNKFIDIDCRALGGVGIQVTGGISGDTLTCQGTIDGTNWVPIKVAPVGGGPLTSTLVTTGIWQANTPGLLSFRVILTSHLFGSSTVTLAGSEITLPVVVQVSGDTQAGSAQSVESPVLLGGVTANFGFSPNPTISSAHWPLLLSKIGQLFTLGGHPNIQTSRVSFTSAQTDWALASVASGSRIVITKCSVMAAAFNSVPVSVRVGFGTVNTPTDIGVVLAHPGLPAGMSLIEGDAGSIIGIGANDADLRVTCSDPTNGSIDVLIAYFTMNI